jgi:hypothetical protein
MRVTNVGVAALAREVGLTEAAISKKMTAGMTADQIRREARMRQGQRPLSKTAKKEAERPAPTRQSPGRPPTPTEYDQIIAGRARMQELEETKLRREKALAERQEIEVLARRGELIPLAYARRWMTKFLVEGRDTLLQGPSELQDALAAEVDPLKCGAIVRAWVERAMAKFDSMREFFASDSETEKVA